MARRQMDRRERPVIAVSYVVRGGAWTMGATDLRAANSIWYGAKDRNEDIGFRIARTLD